MESGRKLNACGRYEVAVRSRLCPKKSDVGVASALHKKQNPTHGSEWMFQILSTTNNRTYSRIPPTEVGGLFRSSLQKGCSGTGKIPPTAVGGLFRSCLRSKDLGYSKALNHALINAVVSSPQVPAYAEASHNWLMPTCTNACG